MASGSSSPSGNLARLLDLRAGVAKASDAFRVSHFELHPELTIDFYAGHLLATHYPKAEKNPRNAARYWCEQAASALKDRFGMEARSAVWKSRPDNLSHSGDEPARPDVLFGEPPAGRFQVTENGVPLWVSLEAGFSTGLFLDMRDGRKVVGAQVRRRLKEGRGVRTLNLFSYTGAFSVVAALRGAPEVVEVDIGPRWLDWARANAELSGVQGSIRQVRADAVAYLADLAGRGERFDIIVIDPPSYATSREGRFTVRDGYLSMAHDLKTVLAPGGLLLAASNLAGWSWASFRQSLAMFRLVERLPPPPDFPGADYLKAGLFEPAR